MAEAPATVSPLGSALPFEEVLPPAELSLISSMQRLTPAETSPPSGRGKSSLSRQQWEDLKPVIQRVYIDEGKPFPYLAAILRTEHGVQPTYVPRILLYSLSNRLNWMMTLMVIQEAPVFMQSCRVGFSEERFTVRKTWHPTESPEQHR